MVELGVIYRLCVSVCLCVCLCVWLFLNSMRLHTGLVSVGHSLELCARTAHEPPADRRRDVGRRPAALNVATSLDIIHYRLYSPRPVA